MRGQPEAVDAIQRARSLTLTPIVLGELRAGFARGRRGVKNEQELEQFLASPRVSVAVVDAETSETYALILASLLNAGTPLPTNDLWIAASAMQHGLAVLTADRHFEKVAQIRVRLLPPSA